LFIQKSFFYVAMWNLMIFLLQNCEEICDNYYILAYYARKMGKTVVFHLVFAVYPLLRFYFEKFSGLRLLVLYQADLELFFLALQFLGRLLLCWFFLHVEAAYLLRLLPRQFFYLSQRCVWIHQLFLQQLLLL
jgi:hypothetical protein